MKLRTLAGVIVVAAAGGCTTAPAGSHPGATGSAAASSGAAGYWTESRLLAAGPSRGLDFRAEQGTAAHLARLSLRVGALFEHDANGNHFCTASVVASPGRDLLITAAHCISGGNSGGYRQDIVFIPGYRDGQEPYGVWIPAHLLVAPQWENSSDPAAPRCSGSMSRRSPTRRQRPASRAGGFGPLRWRPSVAARWPAGPPGPGAGSSS